MTNQSILRNTVLAVSLLTVAFSLHAQSPESVSNRVLAYFDHISKEQHLEDYLNLARPKPVSSRYKAAALANLPPNGKVQLSAKSEAKLAALAPILEFHGRSGITEPKVISDNETIFIGLYERCALIITQKALDLLSKEEMEAVVAHELAHELYWDEYRLARESKRDDKAQEIELRCDGIAILTLVRLGLDPAQIVSALRKIAHYDKDTLGANHYTAPDERLAFAHSMINWIKNAEPTILTFLGQTADQTRLAASCSTLSRQGLASHQIETNPKFTIRVYNYAHVSPKILGRGEQEVTIIFNEAGLEPAWLDCPLSMAEFESYPACQQPWGQADLTLRILPRSMAERDSSGDGTLGFALPGQPGSPGRLANVFYHRVEELARKGQYFEFQILGNAIAHEIGHLLLGSVGHPATGIMKAKWNREDLKPTSLGFLRFTSEQAKIMKCEVLSRITRNEDNLASSERLTK
jgi:hypothetical protein